jgi:hypothetical protein
MGKCKLTGSDGEFVDAHIIPKALTRHSRSGEYFIETGNGQRPSKKFSSWYDTGLVTREGEDYLSRLDDFAIRELRQHKLIWSGRTPGDSLDGFEIVDQDSGRGLRVVDGIDAYRLRLFFLSLLWRACASDRHEFSEIVLPDEDLERLRRMILNSDPEPWHFYPIYLTQFSTFGDNHNHSPTAASLDIPNTDGSKVVGRMNTYRFYFDGLIAHIRRRD